MAPDSGRFSSETAVCRDCHRMVRMVAVGVDGELVATDPELITVVRDANPGPLGPGGARRGRRVEHARRVHAERCVDYQQEAERRATAAQLRRYNRKHGRGAGL